MYICASSADLEATEPPQFLGGFVFLGLGSIGGASPVALLTIRLDS
jgi:hypothetical protein